jgi:hypothetical protein
MITIVVAENKQQRGRGMLTQLQSTMQRSSFDVNFDLSARGARGKNN